MGGISQSAKGQEQFKAEIDAAIAHHKFPWERGYHTVKPSGVTGTPGSPHQTASSAPKPHQSYAVSKARAAPGQSLGMRATHPTHRNELSNLWHTYAINHSASPYTKAEHQHNANIYHQVLKSHGKEVADDMHRHAEALRSSGAYTLRNKYDIDESAAADAWFNHQRAFLSKHSAHDSSKAKKIEDEVKKSFGSKSARDMVAHSVLGALKGHDSREQRMNLRKANNISQWLHEGEDRHYFAMADKTVHPGKQDGEAGEVFSSNPKRGATAVGHMRKLMRNPIFAKHAAKTVNKYVSTAIGPSKQKERLLDMLDHFAKHAPDADVRPVIAQHMRKYNIRGF